MARLMAISILFFSTLAFAGGGMGAGGGGNKPGSGIVRQPGFDGFGYRGCYTTYFTWRAAQRDCPPDAIAVEFSPKRWTCDCAGAATRKDSGGGSGGN